MNSETLQDSIAHSLTADRRVVLLVGPPGSGKSRILRDLKDVDIINVGRELARELMPIPKEERAGVALGVLKDLIDTLAHPVVVLDNIELLLLPELKIDLWDALDRLSLSKKLVVAWTGRVEHDFIQWGDPGVPGHLLVSLENCPAALVSMTG